MIRELIKARPRVARPWLFRFDPFWALFGNADDGLFGDDRWRAGRPKTLRLALEWWARNPFHNFCFYVVGVTEHDHVFLSTKPWGEQPGWSFHAVLTPTLPSRFPWWPTSASGAAGTSAGGPTARSASASTSPSAETSQPPPSPPPGGLFPLESSMPLHIPPEAKDAAPGLLGALIALRWTEGAPTAKLLLVIGGATLSYYGTHPVAGWLGAANADGLIGWALGLFGMSIATKVHESIAAIAAGDLWAAVIDWVRARLGLPGKGV